VSICSPITSKHWPREPSTVLAMGDPFSASNLDRAFPNTPSTTRPCRRRFSPRPTFIWPDTPLSAMGSGGGSFTSRAELTGLDDSSSVRNTRDESGGGAFGKASVRRRGISRTRTNTPAERKEQKDRDENMRAMDAAMKDLKERNKSVRGRAGMGGALVPVSPDDHAQSQQDTLLPPQTSAVGEPTEVAIYGVPMEIQYAALSFFERASGGSFYEDYERDAPTRRFNSLSKASHLAHRPLSDDALRKKNRFAGGDNWIKITFDSQEAADRACNASPHIIRGYQAFAEPYNGVFQRPDVPLPAFNGNITSADASPSQQSSHTLIRTHNDSPTPSGTLSSATATATQVGPPELALQPLSPLDSSTSTALAQPQSPVRPSLRIRGAKRAVLLPAEEALLPAPSKLRRALAVIPLVGWVVSGGSELIGGSIPRKDDGKFDYEKASIWWRFWFSVDSWTGWDTCGIKSGMDE
jgi:hypothetical protein